MIRAAKSHDGQQHAELLLLLYHADVHCRHSQYWRDIVFLCSAFVAQDVLKFPERRAKMNNRVILDLSISDIIFSTSCHIFGTWPVPQGLVYGSSGNQGTCTAQGSLNIFSGLCAGLYNMTLALTYLLQVRYEWSEEKLRRYRPFFVFIPFFSV